VNPLDTRFARILHDKLTADLNEAHTTLGSGTQIIREDAAATGMNCVKYMGIIDGLKTALARIKQVNDEIEGKKPD